MPTYVSLVKFSQHGLQTMKDRGAERAEMVKKNAQALGGKLVQAYYCLGEYDVVAIWEFPDNTTAMKAAVMNASLGHIQITTMPAVNRDEWKSLLKETMGGEIAGKGLTAFLFLFGYLGLSEAISIEKRYFTWT